MPTVGALVWMACRPLIKMALSTSCGFILTRMGMFGPLHARGCGQMVIKVFYPALVFSKVVTGISTKNVSAIAPLVVVSILYLVMGGLTSLLVTQFFWVPHRFRYGIHAAGIFGNFGDIPTALIMSVTAIQPFRGQQDSDTAIAYISIFTLAFFLALFPFGGHTLISGDFAGPDRDVDEVRKTVREQLRASAKSWKWALVHSVDCLRHKHEKSAEKRASVPDLEKNPEESRNVDENAAGTREKVEEEHVHEDGGVVSGSSSVTADAGDADHAPASTDKSKHDAAFKERMAKLTATVQQLVTPITLAMLIGLIVAIIRPLKSLFVAIPNSPTPNAPDGQPALAFIMDTCTFLGGGAVPVGLVCLGSALAAIKLPRNDWKVLPIGAITSLAVGKLLIMPVIGFLIVDGFVRVGFIPESDKVLRFVCIFMACVPTSTTQVFLTQIYSPDGTAEHVSAFLIPQYAIMFASMSALTAYTLHVLF